MAVTTLERGALSTAEGPVDVDGGTDPFRRVRDVSSDLVRFDPEAAPLATITMAEAKKETASQPRFEWADKALATKLTYVDTADAAACAANTAGKTVSPLNAIGSVNDLWQVVRTQEVFLITTAGADWTATRNIGGSGTNTYTGVSATLTATDDIVKIGTAFGEGTDKPAPVSWDEVPRYNYVQIFKNSFAVTGTDDASKMLYGKDLATLEFDAALDHKIDLERSALFGIPYQDATTDPTKPFRLTGGLINYFITDNRRSVSTLTEAELESWMETLFFHTAGGNTRTVFASGKIISILDQLAMGRLMMTPSDRTYGIAIGQFVTSHGTLMVGRHRMLVNGDNVAGYGNAAIALCKGQFKMRPLPGRDAQRWENVQGNGEDVKQNMILSELGWKLTLAACSGYLYGVTG